MSCYKANDGMMDQYLSQACLLNQLALCCQYVNNFRDYGGAKHEKVSLRLICLRGSTSKQICKVIVRYTLTLKNIHFDIKPKTAQSWWSASFWQTWNILSIAPDCCNTNSNGKPEWHFVLNGNETDCPYGENKASVAT